MLRMAHESMALPKSTLTKKEQLAKKRDAERLRRERIRADPELHAQYKLDEQLRYIQRKKDGDIKLIADLSPREKRTRRDEVRERVRRYRLKKKNDQQALDLSLSNSSSGPTPLVVLHPRSAPSLKENLPKGNKGENAKLFGQLKKAEEDKTRAIMLKNKFKKRYELLLNRMKKSVPAAPNTKASLLFSKVNNVNSRQKIIKRK